MTKEEILYTALQYACDDLVSMQKDTNYLPHYMQKFDTVGQCVKSYYNNAEKYIKDHAK